jgi:hypothetical protein
VQNFWNDPRIYIYIYICVCVCVCVCVCHKCILYKGQIIFPQILLHFQHTFPTTVTDAVCLSRKTSCSSVRDLHTRCVSARRGLQSDVLGEYPSRGQNVGSWRVLNRDCRGMKKNSPSHRAQTGVWSGIVMQKEKLDSFSSLSETSEFFALSALHLSLWIYCCNSMAEFH